MRACALLPLVVVPSIASAQDIETGATLYRDFCAACHGERAQSGASGDIRGLGVTTVSLALHGAEEMPAFELTEDEVVALVAYLASLQD